MDLKKVYDSIANSWSLFRNKPLNFVKRFLEQKKGTILVAGCGSGRHSFYASKQDFNVTGFDFSIGMIKQAKDEDKKSNYLVADVRALPFKNKTFDNSLCIAVLHHLKPKEGLKALKELKRVTKNESLISVWRKEQERFKNKPKELMVPWGKHERYYYLYDSKEFNQLMSKVFKEIEERNDSMNLILRAKSL